MSQAAPSIALILTVCFFFFLGALFWFHSYTGLGRDTTFLVVTGSLIVGAFSSIHQARSAVMVREQFNDSDGQVQNAEILLGILATGLIFPFAAALVLRLWGRWIGGKATAAERQPGIEGIRAWFCASNLTVGTCLVLCAWLGHDVSPVLGAVVVAALLAASPLLLMKSPALADASTTAAAPVGEDLSAEREKILAMLEAGKLTPEESAELLQALGGSSRSAARAVPLTGGQRFMLIGAALVTLGFFLPWFVFNPGKEASHFLRQMQSAAGTPFGDLPIPATAMNGQFNTGEISISGGDIQHGLGWAVLALALAAALIPYVATTLDIHTARTIRHLCLGLGALIVLYLLTQNIRFVGLGLVIAVAGYAVEIAGALREYRSAA